jgi:hypothetical protein
MWIMQPSRRWQMSIYIELLHKHVALCHDIPKKNVALI